MISALMTVPDVMEMLNSLSIWGIVAYPFSLLECGLQALNNLRDRESLLLTGVAMAQGDGILEFWFLAECVEVDRDAEGRADFVLAAVTLADIAVVIPRDCWVHLLQFCAYLPRLLDKLGFVAQEWRNHCFHGRDLGRERQICSRLTGKFVFAVGARENCENRSINSQGRLDNMRREFFFCLFIKIGELSI